MYAVACCAFARLRAATFALSVITAKLKTEALMNVMIQVSRR